MPTRPEPSQTVVAGDDPAANTEFSKTVPAGEWWALIAVSVSLVQGITQTPQPILIVDDGANSIFEGYGATGAQAASTTCRYTWGRGVTISALIGAGADVKGMAPIPLGLTLAPGYRIRSSTVGIGANSNYGAPLFYVVKYADFPAHLF